MTIQNVAKTDISKVENISHTGFEFDIPKKSASQILREISFGNFEYSKTAVLTTVLALNFDFVFAFIGPEFLPKLRILSKY